MRIRANDKLRAAKQRINHRTAVCVSIHMEIIEARFQASDELTGLPIVTDLLATSKAIRPDALNTRIADRC
jgi:hypothetical protein